MRKMISFLLVVGLLCTQFFAVYANTLENAYRAQKAVVEKTKYAKYIQNLEEELPKFSQEKLKEINKRVSWKETKNQDLQDLLSFIEILTLNLLDTPSVTPAKSNLTREEKSEINKEISILQNTLLDESKKVLENIFQEFKTLSHYKQSGDLSLDFNMNIPRFLEYSFGLNLKNYVSETQLSDSQTQGDIKITAHTKDITGNKSGDISGKVDLISKDGTLYLKTENLHYNLNEMIDDGYKNIIEAVSALSNDNTYISYDDKSSKEILTILKSINIKQVPTKIEKYKNTPLFSSNEKQGDAYKLTPTIHLCSFMKEAMNIFDPLAGKKCSDKQYKNMLEDFHDLGVTILLTPGINKLLSVQIKGKDVQGTIDIKYSPYGLISVIGNIFEPKNKEVNDITFSYLPRKKISLDMKIDEIFTLNANSKLSKQNTILRGEVNAKYAENDNTITFFSEYKYGNFKLRSTGNIDDNSFSCEMGGILMKQYGALNGACNMKLPNSENIQGHIDVKYDTQSQKNNFSGKIDLTTSQAKIFSFNMKNTGKYQYIEQREIHAPEKTISLEELIEKNSPGEESLDEENPYTIETTKFDDYTQTCFNYDNGDYSCDKVYENTTEVCSFYKDLGDTEETCYEYENY